MPTPRKSLVRNWERPKGEIDDRHPALVLAYLPPLAEVLASALEVDAADYEDGAR